MGYYVESMDCSMFLSKDHFDDVYKKMCELNDYDDLKRGGRGPDADWDKSQDRYNPNKWFSWMPHNYPEITENIFDVLQLVGFDWTLDADGNMTNLFYPMNKTGNEDYFLSCFAGFIEDDSCILFKGEEYDDYYRFTFRDGVMVKEQGVINLEFKDPETYNFGKMHSRDVYLADYAKSLGIR